MGCMEELSYLWRLPHKGVARRSTVNLFPHWGNGNYGEVCHGSLYVPLTSDKDMVKNNFPDCLSRSILAPE